MEHDTAAGPNSKTMLQESQAELVSSSVCWSYCACLLQYVQKEVEEINIELKNYELTQKNQNNELNSLKRRYLQGIDEVNQLKTDLNARKSQYRCKNDQILNLFPEIKGLSKFNIQLHYLVTNYQLQSSRLGAGNTLYGYDEVSAR